MTPFKGVTIGDANAGATDTLTITIGGAGGKLADGAGFSGLHNAGAGVYWLSGTAAAITGELDALVFTPKAGSPNTSSTTTFTLSDLSSAGVGITDGHAREGVTGTSMVVVWPETVPAMVGATGVSLSITLVVLSTAGGPPALLTSLSVSVVVEDVLGDPALGVKRRASSSPVIAAAVPDNQ